MRFFGKRIDECSDEALRELWHQLSDSLTNLEKLEAEVMVDRSGDQVRIGFKFAAGGLKNDLFEVEKELNARGLEVQ